MDPERGLLPVRNRRERADGVGPARYNCRVHLTEGQVITLEVSKSDDEAEYRITYSIPVGIKTVKKKNVGILRGRVYDGTVPGGAGLQNIIVRVGPEAVATGADGSFIFPALPPGPHRIYIDPKSIGTLHHR